MFDMGLGELLLVIIVAIFMFGPERCTRLFREAGRVWSKIEADWKDMKRTMND